jgi:hypothetical protein
LSADEWSRVSGSTLHLGRDGEEKIGSDNPTCSSDDDIAIRSRHLVQTQTLRRGCESSDSDRSDDSDVLDPLQNGPEPKRRRILPTKDKTHRGLFKTSRLAINKRRQKPMSCSSTDDESRGTSGSCRSKFSDVGDEEDEIQEHETDNAAPPPNPLTSPSRSSSPSQCESDYQSHMTALWKEAEGVSPKHRTASGSRDTEDY